jgi:excisionase family DNA binding protein
MNKWISTKEATKMLGVSSTTIKRWADEGTLRSTRTAGGHRRFRREAIGGFLRQQAAAGKDSPTGEFFDLLIEESDIMSIRDRIIQLRDQSGDWYRAADHLDDLILKMWSDRPNDNESNARSHVATGRLELALSAISKSFAVEQAAPIVLMATFGGLQMSHRPALVELCVRSEGIEVLRAQQSATQDIDQRIDRTNTELGPAPSCAGRSRSM